MDPDEGLEPDEPLFPWLPPDDRLWRHPSELAGGHASASGATGDDAEAGTTATVTKTVAKSASTLGAHELDRRLWTVALLAGVVGALLASGAGVVAGQYHRSTTVVRPIEQMVGPSNPLVTIAANSSSSSKSENMVVGIADHLKPSIVELLVNGTDVPASGSGVIFRSDGYILTNQHVVNGAKSVIAVTADGRRVNCRLVGSDWSTDIAVVKMQDTKSRAVATLGSSAQLRVGQLAIAIGSPLGLYGAHSVTTGIISAVDRHVDAMNGPTLIDMIQTDAAIEPGSSGGALVDEGGLVVGITTTITLAGQPMMLTLATPIEVATDVANQLLATGKVTHPWVGVQGTDVDPPTAQALGIQAGAVVQGVDSHSPAAEAGVSAGDIITVFAGQPIDSVSDLEASIRLHHPGDRVDITFLHDGFSRTTSLVLLERPAPDYP